MSVKVYDRLREHGAPALPDGWSYRIKRGLLVGQLRVSIRDASLFGGELAAVNIRPTDDDDLWEYVAEACVYLNRRVEQDTAMEELVGKHP